MDVSRPAGGASIPGQSVSVAPGNQIVTDGLARLWFGAGVIGVNVDSNYARPEGPDDRHRVRHLIDALPRSGESCCCGHRLVVGVDEDERWAEEFGVQLSRERTFS
ncbi:hypothetical protein [Amycolatopsis anabasis]|uniref:hypothetical protein n=1 Tax=Amycolatopsis anabasis TaxID=1840409 RepID=UPI00131E17C3|nr:hypothetical protein [Amycolatopsis anabasis]